jgi:hypothetical protein
MKKRTIKAVDDTELTLLLSRLGILDDLISGEIHCMNCNAVITLDNFGGLKYVNNVIHVFCNSTTCLLEIKGV